MLYFFIVWRLVIDQFYPIYEIYYLHIIMKRLLGDLQLSHKFNQKFIILTKMKIRFELFSYLFAIVSLTIFLLTCTRCFPTNQNLSNQFVENQSQQQQRLIAQPKKSTKQYRYTNRRLQRYNQFRTENKEQQYNDLNQSSINSTNRLLQRAQFPRNVIACILAQSYYPNLETLSCLPCSDPNCAECPNDVCVRCKNQITHQIIIAACIQKDRNFDLSELCFMQPVSPGSLFRICNGCLPYFYLKADQNGQAQCQLCDFGCLSCDVFSSNCTGCKPGYFMQQVFLLQSNDTMMNSTISFFECALCQQNCVVCPSESTCWVCSQGYLPLSDESGCYRCAHPCWRCLEPQAGSKNSQFCTECQYPYRILATEDGLCATCDVKQCSNCDFNSSICTQCYEGYIIDTANNQCKTACVQNCILCSINGYCRACDLGFVLVQNFTDYNNFQQLCAPCQLQNCIKCDPTNFSKCIYCFDTFYVAQTGICERCAQNCLQCTKNVCVTPRPIPGQSGTTIFQGQAVPCQVGCSRCYVVLLSETFCIKVQQGYYLSKGKSKICGNSCISCYQSGNNIRCSKCPSQHAISSLDPSQCLRCQQCPDKDQKNCVRCQTCQPGNLTKCLSCGRGSYWIDYQCIKCPINDCQICVSRDFCTVCRLGYSASQNGKKCVQCPLSCLQCSPNDPRICFSCGQGFFLNNENQCQQCGQGCVSCLNYQICQKCQYQYFLLSTLTCLPFCDFPCLNCQADQSNNCTSCAIGYLLVQQPAGSYNKTCTPRLICEGSNKLGANFGQGDGSCIFCALGYYAVGSQCKKCYADNCSQCDKGSLFCQSCFPGFYLKQRLCYKCQQGCKTCLNSHACHSCIDGFTLVRRRDQTNFTGSGIGPCMACDTPCASCFGGVDKCTSCVDGYIFDGWKCLSKANVKYLLTLAVEIEQFFDSYTDVKERIVEILGSGFQSDPTWIASRNFQQAIRQIQQQTDDNAEQNLTQLTKAGRYLQIITIDTVLDQELSIPSSQSASLSAQKMYNSIVPDSTIQNLTVVSLVITSISDNSGSSGSLSDSNTGILFGILIPVAIVIILGALIVIIRFRTIKNAKNKKIQQIRQDAQDDRDHKQLSHSNRVSTNYEQFQL